MGRPFAPKPGDDEKKAAIARGSTKALLRDFRAVKAKLADLPYASRAHRDLSKRRQWITAELLDRYPAALQAVKAVRAAAITKTELRGLDYDHIMIDAIPADERGSDMPYRHRGLSAAQKELLVRLLGWYREYRVRGSADISLPRELTARQVNSARVLVRSGHLRTTGRRTGWWPDFQFTEDGLRVAEELYADLNMNANVLYQSEASGPRDVGPDTRPTRRMTSDAAVFTQDDSVFLPRPNDYGAWGWICALCDNGDFLTDRVRHWQWHMRLAATVDDINWENPLL